MLVVGSPVLINLTTTPSEFAVSAPLVLAVSLTRGPLLLPLGAFQGVAIAHVLAHRDRAIRTLAPVFGLLTGLGVVGAPIAAWLGPPLLRLLHDEYVVSPLMFALLTLAAVVIAVLTLTGAVCLALDQHRAYAAGWVVATIVSVGVLLATYSLDARVAASLVAGPLVGLAIHLAAIRAVARRA